MINTPEQFNQERDKSKEKHKRLFVYAFFRADGEDGVHEYVYDDVTRDEAIQRAKEFWPDADEFKVSDEALGDPYSYLFAKDRFKSMNERIAFPEEAPDQEEFDKVQKHLNELNS